MRIILSLLRSDKLNLFWMGILFLVLGSFLLVTNTTVAVNYQYLALAQAMTQGKLYFLTVTPAIIEDTISFHNHVYWYLGPLPAILLIPGVVVSRYLPWLVDQAWLNVAAVLVTGLSVFRVSKKVGFSQLDSLYLVLAFIGGSMFLGVAMLPSSWYLAHTVVVALIWLALGEYFSRNRAWLIGLCYAGILLTRPSAVLGLAFFIIAYLWGQESVTRKKAHLWQLCLPVAFGMGTWLLYNYARFGNAFEWGYKTLHLFSPTLAKARELGFSSLRHLPANLYYLFLAVPEPIVLNEGTHVLKAPFLYPNRLGMSIFFTSPYLLTLFFQRFKDRFSWLLLATAGLVALPGLLYYSTGFAQFGSRYALDYFPFLFLLFMRNWQAERGRLSKGIRVIISASCLVNLYLLVVLVTYFYRSNS